MSTFAIHRMVPESFETMNFYIKLFLGENPFFKIWQNEVIQLSKKIVTQKLQKKVKQSFVSFIMALPS